MRIGITGADGLLGFHMKALLHADRQHEVRLATRETFASPGQLAAFVEGLDGIVHFAGVNRAPEAEVETMNRVLAEQLVAALIATGSKASLIYSNSTHIERDTAYGRGKKQASTAFAGWAAEAGANYVDLVLPHVFGEFGRPFYNSVVSTFCHQLAHQQAPVIQVDGDLELVHAQEVARRCLAALSANESGVVRMVGYPIKVSELLVRLQGLHQTYVSQVVPDLSAPLDLCLFNTLRSYLYPGLYPVELTLRTDPRGTLFEAVKTHHGGQTFLSTTHEGITRGNHYHLRKVERFLVTQGEAEICLRRLFTNDVQVFRVSGSRPCYVDMPTFHTHSIKNVGQGDLTTMFWTNEIFDPADPDTYAEPVLV